MTAWRHVEVRARVEMLLWTSLPADEIERRAQDAVLDALLDLFCTCDDERQRVGGAENPDHMTRTFWPCEAPVGGGRVHVIDGESALRKAYGDE